MQWHDPSGCCNRQRAHLLHDSQPLLCNGSSSSCCYSHSQSSCNVQNRAKYIYIYFGQSCCSGYSTCCSLVHTGTRCSTKYRQSGTDCCAVGNTQSALPGKCSYTVSTHRTSALHISHLPIIHHALQPNAAMRWCLLIHGHRTPRSLLGSNWRR
jgi:hypothetical protein